MAHRTPRIPARLRSSLEADVVTAFLNVEMASRQRPCSASDIAFSGVRAAAALSALGIAGLAGLVPWAAARNVQLRRLAISARLALAGLGIIVKKNGAGGGVFACPILLHRGTSSTTSTQAECFWAAEHW